MGTYLSRRRMLGGLAIMGGTTSLFSLSSRPTAAQSTTVGEIGTASCRQSTADEWHSLSFGRSYVDPVVVMGPLSKNGGQPGHIRTRDVANSGLKWQIEEWEYLDEKHTR